MRTVFAFVAFTVLAAGFFVALAGTAAVFLRDDFFAVAMPLVYPIVLTLGKKFATMRADELLPKKGGGCP